MTPERALRELIEKGDIAQVGGEHVLVSELSYELLEYIAAFDADQEDIEDEGLDEDGAVTEASEQRAL
jgi:hypothetical protein